MARDDDPPPAKRPRAVGAGSSSIDGAPPPARTDCTGAGSIRSLPGDLLREILLGLDSLSDLVRAACTCQEWRDEAASTPDFRRKFIKRHPAPLLGFFIDTTTPHVPGIPSFAPCRGEDSVLVAALSSGEFLQTTLQRHSSGAEPSWFVLDARGGYLLLINWGKRLLALLNPLARPHERIFHMDDARIFDDDHASPRTILHAGVILHDDNPEGVDIFCLVVQGESRLRAAIFSSVPVIGGGWILSAWLEVPPHPPIPGIDGDGDGDGGFSLWLDSGMRVGNFIYWPYTNLQHVVILDPTDRNNPRLSVEVIRFPAAVNPGIFGRYIIGETQGHKMSIAYTNGFVILLRVRAQDGMDAGTWALVKEYNLTQEVVDLLGRFPADHDRLELVAMRGSILYFRITQPDNPCWFMSLCLETGKRERLFTRDNDAFFQPYHHLSWTSSLSPDGWRRFI